MRTDTINTDLDRKELLRVKVANSVGSMTDLSAWVMSASLNGHRNNMALSASVTFWREQPSGSLAPLMNSPAPIAAGRRITIETAILAKGATVQASDWIMVLDGTIDIAGWGSDEALLTVPARDKAAVWLSTWIEDKNTYGSDSSPIALETVMQDLIDDVRGSSVDILTVVGDPDFGVYLYEQQKMSLARALQELDLIGWDMRFLWSDGASDFLPTFYEPDRTKTTPDHTFSTDDYFSLTDVSHTIEDVRNVVEIIWDEDEDGVVVEDATSIALFDRKYMELDYSSSSLITSQAQALVLGTAILADVAQPPLTHVSENALFPLVEIGDLYRFAANNVHYNTAQDVAVVGFTHQWGPDGNSTVLECRGAPAGSTARWYTKARITALAKQIDPPDPPELSDYLLALYTTKTGSAGYTLPGTAAGSLGGYASTTECATTLNGLFRTVTDDERLAGITLYRTLAFVNTNDYPTPLPWNCVRAWLDSAGTNGVTWAIGLDPVGVASYTRAAELGAESADEETAPAASPAIAYVSPTSVTHGDVLIPGTVDAGEGFLLHIRLTIPASPEATAQQTDSSILVRDTTPCDP